MSLILWVIVLLAGLALEVFGWLDERDGLPTRWHTLSYYIRKYVPPIIIAAGLTWLARHFDILL